MKKKVTVVGCGLIAEKKHIPSFLKMSNLVDVVAVCDLNETLARKLSNKFNIKKCYIDFLDMLQAENPDIVNICTPPQTHAKLASIAIEHGAHVVVEKPMALTISDCNLMIESAEKHRKKIGIIHNQLFNPAFVKAKEIVSSGELGDFVGMQIFLSTPTSYITSIENHWAHKLPGGILGETGPHSVYLASTFLKDIYDVEICAKKLLDKYKWSPFEDYRFNLIARNGICSVTQIYSTNQWAANINIFCTNGFVRVDLETRTVIKHFRGGLNVFGLGFGVLNELGQKFSGLLSMGLSYFLGNKIDPHYVGISDFVDSIISNKDFSVTPASGREIVRIMEMLVDKLNKETQLVSNIS